MSPIVGYCLLTFAGWYFYEFNFKGTDAYYYWVLLIATILLTAAIAKIWKQKLWRELFSRELVIPALIGLIIFFMIAIPSLLQKEMTTMSLGNNDIAAYALSSEAVKELPRTDVSTVSYFPTHVETLGGFIDTAFFCSVAKLEPHQVQMMSLYLFFIVSVFLTYILGREVFKYTTFGSNSIMLLYGLNSILVYIIYQGFENQIIAVPLMLFIMLINVLIVKAENVKSAAAYLPLLVLSLWALSLTYSHMIVIIYALLLAYVLVSCVGLRRTSPLARWGALNCLALLVISCLSPHRLQMVVSNTLTMSDANAGWFMPWTTPQKLFGIASFLIPDGVNLQPNQIAILQNFAALTVIISVLLTVMIVAGFVRLYSSNRESFFFSIMTFTSLVAGAFILSIWNIPKTGQGFGGYNQFKLMSFFLPLLLLSSFALLGNIEPHMPVSNVRSGLLGIVKSGPEYLNIKKGSLYFVVLVALVITNGLSLGVSLYAVNKHISIAPVDAISLQGIRNNEEIGSINIPSDGGIYWNIMWEAYSMFPKKLFFEQPTYYPSTPLNGEWWLVRNDFLVISYLDDPNTIIPINSRYSLRRASSGFNVQFGVGWSDSEEVRRWTIADDASIIVYSNLDNIHTNLTLKYNPLNIDNRLSLYLNGNKVQDCDDNSSCLVKDLVFRKGENVIEFKAKLPPQQPGYGDPRELCYCFQLIKFEQVK